MSDGYYFVINESLLQQTLTGAEMIQFLEYVGQQGEGIAKEHAPLATGNLRRSITHEVNRGRNPFVRIGTNVRYAIYQELGTRFHPAHPYLRVALEQLKSIVRGY
jgi:HK97 gp10 family phage protein